MKKLNLGFVPLLLSFALVFAAAGCKKEKISNKVEGLWSITSHRFVIRENGVLKSDVTQTVADGLDQMYFDADGTGWIDWYTNAPRVDLVWDVDQHTNELLVTPKDYPNEVVSFQILELERERMVLRGTSSNFSGTVYDHTYGLSLAD